MRVILTEDIPKLGNAGEVVKVKRGYGRNYLLPQGKAQLATEGRVKEIEHQKRVIEEKVQKEVAEFKQTASAIGTVELRFEMQANAEGKLFGSVTNIDVHQKLTEAGHEFDRRKIVLAEPIKQVGDFEAMLRLHREVEVQLKLQVVSSGEPAAEDEEEPSVAEQAMLDAEVQSEAGED